MADSKKRNTENQGFGYVLLVLTKFAGWVFLIVAGCLVGMARPKSSTIADKIYQTVQRQRWNMDLIEHVAPVLIAAIVCTPIGLAIYLIGLRQKRYAFPVSLIVTGLLAVAALVAFYQYAPGS